MATENWLAALAAAFTLIGVIVTIALFVLGRIREDIQNLFRIKESINKALAEFKEQVATNYVTYERMGKEIETATKPVQEYLRRIEDQLKSLNRLESALTHLAAKLDITLPQKD